MTKLAILGSTGSIGTQALELIRLHPDRFSVGALTAHRNKELLFAQVREFRPEMAGLTEPIDMIVADLSFISLTMVLPHCLQWLREGGIAVCLIKPQFEVGAGQTVKGVVKDEAIRQEAVDRVLRYMENEGLTCLGVTPAAIKGPKGNQEYLAYWKKVSPKA